MSARAPRQRGAQVVRGRFRHRRRRAVDPRAFQIWRSAVTQYDAPLRLAVGHDLAPIALIAEPRWPDAAAGDAAVAIQITLEHLWTNPVADIRRDLILSALWACASAGDPASKLLLAVMCERFDEV